ncbi:MAG: calcium-binding protein [Nitrosomonas sp.]|nr:calcium-binding protein [Nitrosomonas sp.]
MAISDTQKEYIVGLVVGLFNAAPGANYLREFSDAIEAGTSFEDLADFLVSTPQFQQDVLKGNVTIANQVSVLMNNFGLTPGNTDPASADAQAEQFFTDRLNAGADIGDIVIEAGLYLLGSPAEAFQDTANLFKNKMLVAGIYSRENSAGTVAELQNVIKGVTAEGPATEEEAIAFLVAGGHIEDPDAGETFTLTLNEDNILGTSANDTFNASIIDDKSSLQDIDTLNGGLGTDTLNATVNGGSAVIPTLTNIENVILRSVADNSGIDLTNSTGVEKVTVANSTKTAAVSGLGSVGTLAVSNQTQNVDFWGSKATELTVNLTNVATNGDTTINLKDAVATTLTLNLSGNGTGIGDDDHTLTLAQNDGTATTVNANVTGDNFVDAVNALDAAKTLAVAGSGALTVSDTSTKLTALETLNVSGGASVDLSAVGNLDKLKTVAAGDTTGAVSVIVDDTAVAVATGAGNDSVEYTKGIAAGATVTLGAGDDELTVTDATKGATVNAGEGTDTLAGLTASLQAISDDADKSAVFAGFEVLKTTDAIDDGDHNVTIALANFAGITSFVAGNGVATGAVANVTGVGSGSTVTLAGDLATNNGVLTVTLADATGGADALNFVINTDIAVVDDANVDTTNATITTAIAGVETLNVTSTGTLTGEITEGNEIDVASNTLALTNTALTTLNIDGDQFLTFASTNDMTKLATVNAANNTAGVNIDVSLAKTDGSAAAITITGSSGDDTIKGSGNADTISGGAGNDTITGGAKADNLAGGEGNDIFAYTALADSTLVNLDVISDFTANTFGQGTSGAADDKGASFDNIDDWTGDVIDLSVVNANAQGFNKIDVSVQANSSDAQTFLQNLGQTTADTIGAALDSSTGRVLIDIDSNGTADMVIQLTGVTTIDEAAFIITGVA